MNLLRRPIVGVLAALVLLSHSGCQCGESTAPKSKVLSTAEQDRLRLGFDLVESEAKELSEIEHRYSEMTNSRSALGDSEALKLTPEQYAKTRRERAIDELVRVLMDRGFEIRREKTELLNTIRSDASGVFAK